MTTCVEFDPSGYIRQSSSETCEYVLTPAGSFGIAGFESEAFSLGVLGVLLMFAVGAGVGLSINVLRKARTP